MNQNVFRNSDSSMAWYQTGQSKPVLMLHGWGSSAEVMTPLAGKLEPIRTSYLVDFPGFGRSPEPSEAWALDDYTDLIEEFIKREIPEGELDLIAHSFGARVAIKLLTRDGVSSRIDKIVFTGAAGLKPKRSLSYYIKKYTAKTLKGPFWLLSLSYRERGLKKLRQSSLWKRLGSSDYRALSGTMRQTFVACANEHLDYLVPQIEQEILLIWGKKDTATPLNQARRMEALLKKSALILIDDAGHYAFLDKPARFASILKAYFNPENSA